MKRLLLTFNPTKKFRSLCLVLLLVSMFETPSYAGADMARHFSQDQSRAAKEVEQLILSGDQVIVYSLDPTRRRFPDDGHKKFFHGFKILGKANIVAMDTRKILAGALADDIRGNTGVVAACFEPRHGLRISNGTEVKDLVICFECASARCYNFNSNRGMLVSGSSSSEFNKFLDLHRVRRVEAKD